MSKKILLLILSFIILQSLFVNAVSPSMPMPIGIKLTNDCIPLSNFKICVENERTMERICELTNDNGEQIFNLANFEKSYSYGDLIKIIYCIDTPICEETYLIQKIESNVGGYNFLRDVSEDNIKKGSKTFIIMCTDDFAVDYLNVSLKYEGRIILNKIIEGQGRQLNYKLNLTVPIGLEHEFIAECVDTSGNKKVSKEYFLINNKEDENEPLIIYVNNTIL